MQGQERDGEQRGLEEAGKTAGEEGEVPRKPGEEHSLGAVAGGVSDPKVNQGVIAVAMLVQDSPLLAERVEREAPVVAAQPRIATPCIVAMRHFEMKYYRIFIDSIGYRETLPPKGRCGRPCCTMQSLMTAPPDGMALIILSTSDLRLLKT